MDGSTMGRIGLGVLVFVAGAAVLGALALAAAAPLVERAVPRFSAAKWKVLSRLRGRRWWVYSLLLAASGAAAVLGGMDVVQRSETPEFCGSCHEMQPRFRAWESSPHAEVTCADCHWGRGFGGWVRAKTDGMRELCVHLTADSFDHIRLTERQVPVVNANCKRCHATAELPGQRDGLAISHEEHLAEGAECLACHSSGSSHPPEPAGEVATAPVLVAEARCYGCHDGTPDQDGEVVFDARAEGSCVRCHPQAGLALDHGDEGTCGECHDAHTDEHFPLGADSVICAKCHREHVDDASRSPHDPERPQACGDCHLVMSPATLYGSGPRPGAAQCYACHEDYGALVRGAKPALSGGFFDGDTDLHELHLGEDRGPDSEWCFDCHRVHPRKETRGDIDLRVREGQTEPGVFEARPGGGGRCAGGCHSEKAGEYGGPGAATAQP